MDQWLAVSLGLVGILVFVVALYIINEERKSRKVLRSGRVDGGPDDVEKRARRAF